MLNTWLNWNERDPCPYSQFKVIDIEQKADLSPEVTSYLNGLLRAERFAPEYLGAMSEYLGWQRVRDLIVATQVPRTIAVKRGEFGEVLITAILEQFYGYSIPVPKLRFKITANQSLPATDVLALKIDDKGSIAEVCFVESKLRTSSDDMAAVEGHRQLQEDYESKLPDILSFISQRLYERKDSLFDAFASYLCDRRDTTDRDTFRLSLCWEHSAWREKVLENLQDDDVTLPRLTVHVIRINNLRQLTDELFAALGVTEVHDDD